MGADFEGPRAKDWWVDGRRGAGSGAAEEEGERRRQRSTVGDDFRRKGVCTRATRAGRNFGSGR